jgi:PLP dependent protein
MEIEENLNKLNDRIIAACHRSGRHELAVKLVAVSKTFPTDFVLEAFEAGQLVFGESKLQEAEPKIASLPRSLEWHFIGRVQRNKVRRLLQNFKVIHAIDSFKLAAYTAEIANELGLIPQVFLQINIGGESSKGGFETSVVRSEMENLLRLKCLNIIGLMCIPPAATAAESSREWFASLRNLRNDLELEFSIKLPALSMGMSGDYQVAIEEGATHIRVGSAIFGKRAYRVDGELG